MKKTILLTLLAAGFLARSATATITLNASPSSQTAPAGGTFNVSLTLSVTQNAKPAFVAGFDLYFVAVSGNTNRFAITAATPTGPLNASGPVEPMGGDSLSTPAANGFVRNGIDQSFVGNPQATPLANFPLANYTFSIAAGTPAGTYTFSTSTSANAGIDYSDVSDSAANNGAIYPVDNAGTFSITVVPEPSTYGLLALGAVGFFGVHVLRRKACRI